MSGSSYNSRNFLLVFGLPLLLRWPLLHLGFGVEEDAWGHVLNALEMNAQGEYVISRLPGHPAMEALCWLLLQLFGLKAWAWNLTFALAGSWCSWEFYRLLIRFNVPSALGIGLGFNAIPVVLFSGTTTMDYLFQLLLLLLLFRQMLEERWIWVGVLLGLAMSFRLTSALFALAIAAHWLTTASFQWKNTLQLALPATLVVMLSYWPAYQQLGWGFFSTYSLPYPPLAKVLYKGSVGAFGLLGVLAFIIFRFGRKKSATELPTAFIITLIGLHVLLFLRLPEKSAFLLPAVPFLTLWMGSGLSSRNAQIFAVLLMINPFVFGIHLIDPHRGSSASRWAFTQNISTQSIAFDPLFGAYIGEWTKRKNKQQYVEDVLHCAEARAQPNEVVIAGWWYAMLKVTEAASRDTSWAQWQYYLPPEKALLFRQQGLRIFALPEQEAINQRKYASSQFSKTTLDYPCP